MYMRKKIAMVFRTPFLVYILEFLSASAIAYTLLILYPQHKLIWAMSSIALVISPKSAESKVLVFDRVRANIIGAAVASLLLLFFDPNMTLCCFGILLTIMVSKVLKVYKTVRSALVTFVIIMIPAYEGSRVMIALDRLFCVIIGCAIALTITFLVDTIIDRIFRHDSV